jgi:hypothetical protein
MRKRWEYLVRRVQADEVISNERHLNDLGANGWELVGVGSFTVANYLYFRRPAVTAGKPGEP